MDNELTLPAQAQSQVRPGRRRLANAIRALSMDAVQQANSGHPGAPMGMADLAEVLWNDFLRHNPADPRWPDRDRFVLSNGHGSMLLYALLHLSGYDLPMEELRRFRQLHSKTPGHPEYGLTPGVETTTGPLGQGLGSAVGMALAEKVLAEQFNRPGHTIVDHGIYVCVGDGCLMEGISHEACSLAGALGLGKLIAIYDDNGISIDGEVQGWFRDDTGRRFEAYGWHVIHEVDGHDPAAFAAALTAARAEHDRPSLIRCRTVIGWGAPTRQGTEACHGSPLGPEEVARARAVLGWDLPPFEIPADIYAAYDARERGRTAQRDWEARFTDYAHVHPDLAAEFRRRVAAELPGQWDEHACAHIAATQAKAETMATRKASLKALEAYAPVLPELFGGSADLTESNQTLWSGSRTVNDHLWSGNYLHYGVREFAMTAMLSGMALHGGFIPYGGTFLVFSDYARNAVRLAALMGLRSILVYTHDSIGLGEDGPTHQPIEHLPSLRLMPNLSVWRPCDATETSVAWKAAIERRAGPTALVLTRQNLPPQVRTTEQVDAINRGGYTLIDTGDQPDVILIATGSEVEVAIAAANRLKGTGRRVRVVSIPCLDVFEAQPATYRETVLPAAVTRRVAIEAAACTPWFKYVGLSGAVVGLKEYGASAPGGELFKHFGLTEDHVVQVVESLLASEVGGVDNIGEHA